ncbi:MAG: ASKHA domain-containing protein [Eubacteriales bacterium]
MKKSFKIKIKADGKTIVKEYNRPVTLLKALGDCGISVDSECGGRGVCGKCEVTAAGSLSAVTKRETQLFGQNSQKRLACLAVANGDSQIIYNTKKAGFQVLSEGITPKIEINSGFGAGVGVAIDIGTTTVAAGAYDLATGKLIESFAFENPQRAHGGDVVTRMDFALKGGLETLKTEINGVINKIKSKAGAKIAVVSGNTAMLHFAAGLSTDKMAVSPFAPESLFGFEKDGVYFLPCGGAYFGADIVCGIAACGMADSKNVSFIADIGTNGEMALFDGKDLICCSTAAGPAFEGYGIERGMPAVNGAVNGVYLNENNTPRYTVIGGGTPAGICGSGLADLAAALLKIGVIDKSGYMEENYYLTENVYLTPRDVRNLQLAKAAIRGGIETLLGAGGEKNEVEKFYLAGGMGNSINIESAAALGIIPADFAKKATLAGNASLSGAAGALLDAGFLQKISEIAGKCKIIELADSDLFGENFIKYMAFGG